MRYGQLFMSSNAHLDNSCTRILHYGFKFSSTDTKNSFKPEAFTMAENNDNKVKKTELASSFEYQYIFAG